MGTLLVLDVFLGFSALYLLKKFIRKQASPNALPPGPKGLPIIGNIFDLPNPSGKAWLDWRKLKKLYGPLSSVTIFGQTIVVLNDYNTAAELLDRNSAVCSNRPESVFGGEMYTVPLFRNVSSADPFLILHSGLDGRTVFLSHSMMTVLNSTGATSISSWERELPLQNSHPRLRLRIEGSSAGHYAIQQHCTIILEGKYLADSSIRALT